MSALIFKLRLSYEDVKNI